MTRYRRGALFVVLVLLGFATEALAAGPRWVAGQSWANNGHAMTWYRNDVQYFVDAGPLSASVDHDTAVALVDAAASVWTVSGIPFSLANGGSIAEDVNGSNVYMGSNGPVWPADVQSSNYAAKQIAVVFDSDGSITDTLLGAGASAPANCRTAAVTESVDLFIQPGNIAHAIIVLNGRCTGSAPEQQLQLRYQLMRTFGRVIGLGWSQLNDNVFTGTPAPTYQDQMHWPIMHPIDILCGLYSYQCLPQPFTLREDDVASLAQVYATSLQQSNPGRISVLAWLRFPSGQGMNGVNVVAHRNWGADPYGTEEFGIVSAVSGAYAPGDFGNPVTGPPADTSDKGGSPDGYGAGFIALYGIPVLSQYPFTNFDVETEAINPLYSGQNAVGPYHVGSVAPAGDSAGYFYFGTQPGLNTGGNTMTPPNAPYQCATGSDGTEAQPAPLTAGGIWTGLFCATQHSAWTALAVRAGRTATVEVTALDGNGLASTAKAMPVIGLWHASDATGTPPTLARTAAFNAIRAGTTQLRATFTTTEQLRLALADQRGDGRPDYLYRARFLYADTVTPARVPQTGGTVRIAGSGFTPGCTVTVGGVLSTVVSQTSTELEVVAPTFAALNGSTVNDVVVTDTTTTGSTTISGGLTYEGASGDVLSLVTAPGTPTAVGASVAFAVRLVDSTGTAAPNATITVSTAGGQVVVDACSLSTCVLTTDGSGTAQTRLVSQTAGNVTLTATAKSGSTVQATFTSVAPPQAVTLVRPTQYVAAGSGAVFHPTAQVTGSASVAAVVWQASPSIALGAVHTSGSTSQVDATGSLRDGEMAFVQACASLTTCTSGNVVGVAATDLRMQTVSGDTQSVSAAGSLQPITLRAVDTAGHAVAGALVTIYQRVTGWQPPCALSGRCAVAPVYGTASNSVMSDDDGLLTVQPLQYAATAGVTSLTATDGTAGTLTVTLQKNP